MRTITPETLDIEVLETGYSLGKLIAASRKAQGITQTELCGLAGVGRSTLVEIEHGSPKVQFAHWMQVMHKLGLLAHLTSSVSAFHLGQIANAVPLRKKR